MKMIKAKTDFLNDIAETYGRDIKILHTTSDLALYQLIK